MCNDKNNHVVELTLYGMLYKNEISLSLLQLKYWEHLILTYRNFNKILEFIGSLTRLAYLDLLRNTMNAAIPFQLSNLTNLHFLMLGGAFVVDLQWISHLFVFARTLIELCQFYHHHRSFLVNKNKSFLNSIRFGGLSIV